MSLDKTVFIFLNGLAGRSSFLDGLFIFLAEYLPYLTVLVAVILFIVWHKSLSHKMRAVFVFGALSVLSYLFVYFVFHTVWPRQRPFFDIEEAKKLVDAFSNSFPSKHAFFFFFLASFASFAKKKIGLLFFASAVLISISRVVVGVHYPLDVISGAFLGIALGLLAVKILKKM